MSVECLPSENGFILRGIEGCPGDVVLEKAQPGWTARTTDASDDAARDSALTRTRAVERLLRQSLLDPNQLAAAMTEIDRALDACPETAAR